jgi:hypothetical protein
MLVFFADLRAACSGAHPRSQPVIFFAHHFKDFEKKMENVGQPPPLLYENSCINFSVSSEYYS